MKGTVEIVTGLGKTFIALHALRQMPIDKSVTHLFLAEVVDRKRDLYIEILKYNAIFKTDILNDYNLQFACYQSAYKWVDKKFGLVIGDEIHDGLTPSYSKFFKNNKYDAIIALSALINQDVEYKLGSNTIVTKGDLLNEIAPICYSYNLKESISNETSRNLNINVIFNHLDSKNKYIKGGSTKKPFYQTEYSAYKYWDGRFKKAYFIDDPERKGREFNLCMSRRANILYNLKTKINTVKNLLLGLNTKSILFSNSLKALDQITPNVISSKKSKLMNDIIKDNFNNDKINIIASFKKLKQGVNLVGLDNCIIMSYYSKDSDFIQRIGRLRDNGQVGNVFILVTKNTQEEIWFSKMIEGHDLKINYFNNVEECLKSIKN